MRAYFDELAGKFGRNYVPGRSWQGLAETLLTLMPPMVIADLGAGEGTFSQLLARRSKKVIAVDNSEKMVEYGRELARKHGVKNLEYRKGDLEEVPIKDAAVDLAFFSQALHHAQHPERAVAEAWRILKPGGRIVVLDFCATAMKKRASSMPTCGSGSPKWKLRASCDRPASRTSRPSMVHSEESAPHFETLLAVGDK